MRLSLLTVLLLMAALLTTAPAMAGDFSGPLDSNNQFPLFNHFSAAGLESAVLESSVSASLTHSSVHMVKNSTDWSVGLDMEVTELALGFRKTFWDKIELGVRLPLVVFSSGILDRPLDSYHSAFGLSDYGKSKRAYNAFLYEVKVDGETIIKGDNGKPGLGDISLSAKKPLYQGTSSIVSIRASIDLPTGDAKNGYGNGSVDYAIMILVDFEPSERIRTYLNAGYVLPGNVKALGEIETDNYQTAGLGLEMRPSERFSLLGQIFIQGSPYPHTAVAEIDETAVLLAVGGRYVFGKNLIEITFTEDPNTSGAPDFSLGVSYKLRFP